MGATGTATRKRRPLVWVAAAVAVVVAGAALAIYLFFFHHTTPKRFAVSSTPSKPIDPSQLGGTWTIAPGSEVGYRVREKLAILPEKSDAVGRTAAVTGTVAIQQTTGSVVVSDVQFEADLTSLKSDRSQRDDRMHTVGLESNTFPKATFVSRGPVTVPPEAVQGQKVTVPAVGDLTIHGVTKRVTIPVDAHLSGAQIELAGSLNFPLTDYGIDIPSFGGFVTVDGDANLEFHLLLKK
ncbi:MAG: hypothetical protein QOG64_3000 [Acidimicrobiaceae bacterium]|jgi:polyisoprenoid-binding protein YceI|nr:hypothetical protein [Acidimicrobiaceae bacterium]